jgi:branched-chain amino acid transport system permease protein
MSSNLGPTTTATDLHDDATTHASGHRMPRWEPYLGWLYLVLLIAAVAALIWLPFRASAYTVTFTLYILLTISLATSWNYLSGFGGYTSFGHAGFFGVGSYTGALLLYYEKVSWIPAVILAGLATSALALVIGYPMLRLRGPYFAVGMLAFSELGRVIVTSWDELTLGGRGVYLPIVRLQREENGMSWWERFQMQVHNDQNYYAMLALAVVAVVIAYMIGTSRFGLRLLAIRDDEVAAQAMGIATTRVKMTAFTISAFFPGVAGAIYARQVGYIDPVTVFAVVWSIRAIATAIVGGQGTILGPIIGAVVLTVVSEKVWEQDPNLYQVIFGAIIVLVVLFMPGGLIALLQQWGVLPRSRRL